MNALFLSLALLGQVDYDVIAVRSRLDDTSLGNRWAEVFQAATHRASDVANLSTGQVIVNGNGVDANFDPKMSLDGQWVYYVKIPETSTARNGQRGHPVGYPSKGADIYRTHLTTGQTVRLTGQHWVPPTSVGTWVADPSKLPPHDGRIGFAYGVCNLGPQPLPGGKVAFTSNRNGYQPPKGFAGPHMQLFVIDDIPGVTDQDGEDGRNVECIGHLNVSSALHPTLMTNGEITWASHESQGLRDRRLWGQWHSYPDGRAWGPIHSAYTGVGIAYHFQAQRSDGNLVTGAYYNLNNWGFGALIQAPLAPEMPTFLSPVPADNPLVRDGWLANVVNTQRSGRISTMRRGTFNLTPNVTFQDEGSVRRNADGTFTEFGKYTHPSGAPGNHVLATFSPGTVNTLNRPYAGTPHSKIAVIRGQLQETDPEILFESDEYHYTQPIAAVPWAEIYGSEPPEKPFLPNPSGTPFARLQLASSYIGQWKSETDRGAGLQGHWSGHPQEVPAGLDIVQYEPVLADTYWNNPDGGWSNRANERMRVLARVMFDEPDRPEGDTSVDVLIPADVPYGMRTFASDGRTISWSQTWKQARPGEGVPTEALRCPVMESDRSKYKTNQCGGCHNHSGDYIPFEGTYASLKAPKDFRDTEWETPEFNRDIKPILEAKCNHCHNETHPVKLDETLANSIYVSPSMSFASRLSKAIRGEGATGQMPLGEEPLTDAEMRLFDRWIDYFCTVSQHAKETGKGAWADITKPTVYVPRSGTLNIGVFDLSGIESVTATLNGQPLTLPEPVDAVYQTGHTLAVGDRVVVTAVDGAGNRHEVDRLVRVATVPPVDPPDPTLAELQARVTALEEAQAMTNAQLMEAVQRIAELERFKADVKSAGD